MANIYDINLVKEDYQRLHPTVKVISAYKTRKAAFKALDIDQDNRMVDISYGYYIVFEK